MVHINVMKQDCRQSYAALFIVAITQKQAKWGCGLQLPCDGIFVGFEIRFLTASNFQQSSRTQQLASCLHDIIHCF